MDSRSSLPPRRGPAAPPSALGRSAGAPRRGPEYASVVPLAAGVAAFVASAVIAVVVLVALSAPATFAPGVAPPVVVPEWSWLSLLGYLAAPVAVVVLYGLDRSLQRAGRRRNVEFEFRPWTSTTLRILVVAGIVLGLWHLVNVAVPLTEWLGWA